MIIDQALIRFDKAREKAWLFFKVKAERIPLTKQERDFMKHLEEMSKLPVFDFIRSAS